MTTAVSDPLRSGANHTGTVSQRVLGLLGRWYTPKTGRFTVFMLLVLQLGICSTLRSTNWVDFETARLGPEWLTLGGMLSGWIAARMPTRKSIQNSYFVSTVTVLGALCLACLLLLQQLTGAFERLPQLNAGVADGESLAVQIGGVLAQARVEFMTSLVNLGDRIDFWLQGVRGSGARQDDLIFIGICGLVLYAIAFQATWMTLTDKSVLVALFPSVLLTAFVIFYSQGSRLTLVAYLAGLFLLYTYQKHRHQMAFWEVHRMDYPDSLLFDRTVGAIAVLVVMIGVAWVVPSFNIREIQQWANSVLRPVDEATTDIGTRMFPEMQSKFHGRRQSELGGLPNSFLLGAPPDITNSLVLTVTTNNRMDEAESFYMRAKTFQHYDGRGWSNPESGMATRIEANEDLPPVLYPHVRSTWQSVTRHNQSSLLYAIPEPVRVSVPLVPEHDQAESVLFYRVGGNQTYNVLSHTPRLGETVLRSVTLDTIPESLDEAILTYLQLPDSISDQTRLLAEELSQGHSSVYDLGLAIEAYLRDYPYDLDVRLPGPEVQDVAHFFLFELKRGYCDYYTTAFVALARLAGIPTRFAIGYAPGYFEPYVDEWTFTDAQAHSWPEVWFPGLGWIPFEPTSGRASLDRRFVDPGEFQGNLESETEFSDTVAPQALPRGFTAQSLLWIIFMIPVGYLAWHALRRRARTDVWLSLLSWGARAGTPKHPADTETEFLANLEQKFKAEPRLTADAFRFLRRALQQVAMNTVQVRYARATDPASEETLAESVSLVISRLQRLWVRSKLKV